MAAEQRWQALVSHELDVTGPTETERGNERRQRQLAAPEYDPVYLHLLAVIGLETYQRLWLPDCLQRVQVIAQPRQSEPQLISRFRSFYFTGSDAVSRCGRLVGEMRGHQREAVSRRGMRPLFAGYPMCAVWDTA